MYEHNLGLAVTHWKDKRDVFMLTSCTGDGKRVVKRCVESAHTKQSSHLQPNDKIISKRTQKKEKMVQNNINS